MTRVLALVLLLAAPALAQRAALSGPAASGPSRPMPPEAAERYHEAARLYIDGENAPALAAAEAGLALAPGDARLTALRDLIRQEQPPQDSGSPPPTPPDTPPEESPESPPPGQESPPETPPTSPGTPPGAPPSEPAGGADGPQMSREQAEQILDAVGGTERLLLRQMRREPSRVRQNDIDW